MKARGAKRAKFKAGQRVYDCWWPERFGVVEAIRKTYVLIHYGSFGWRYDSAHQRFLRPLTAKERGHAK